MKHRTHRRLVMSSVIVAVLATGFTYANFKRHTRTATTRQLIPLTEASADTTAASSDQATVASTATPALDATQNQDQTYIVKKGDTLYSIGKQIGVNWPALASVNGLDEHSVIKEGQVLKIPTATEAQTVQAQEFDVVTTDSEKQNLQTAQDYANAGTGQLAYRLVPAQVVQRSPLLARFAFDNNDLFIEKTKDVVAGTATVEVTHQGKLFTVYLTQTLAKGDKGVWTPVKVMY